VCSSRTARFIYPVVRSASPTWPSFSQNEKGMQFLGIKRLGEKPLSHAGGFQLAGNWLAIGIEDPVGRNESQVLLIDVSTSKTLNAPPVHVLNRRGQAGRSTAGAVALLRRKDHFLLAVGVGIALSSISTPPKALILTRPISSSPNGPRGIAAKRNAGHGQTAILAAIRASSSRRTAQGYPSHWTMP
jgi:hypothetical protein